MPEDTSIGLGLLALVPDGLAVPDLDGVQGAGASALRPFEIAATRVAAPFRDAASWSRGLFRAKSENRSLRRTVDELRATNAKLLAAQAANKRQQQRKSC